MSQTREVPSTEPAGVMDIVRCVAKLEKLDEGSKGTSAQLLCSVQASAVRLGPLPAGMHPDREQM